MQETESFINPIASFPKAYGLIVIVKKIKIKTRLEKRKIQFFLSVCL